MNRASENKIITQSDLLVNEVGLGVRKSSLKQPYVLQE